MEKMNKAVFTVQEIIDKLKEPVGPIENTIDTLKCGDPAAVARGVATTFIGSYQAIRLAAEQGANLLITHEPIYYNHVDSIEGLEDDEVFEAKRRLIAETGMNIFRFHDYQHRYSPDGITAGFLKEMGWEAYASGDNENRLKLSPARSLRDIAEEIKRKLGVASLQVGGDDAAMCMNIGLFLGFGGNGAICIPAYGREGIDLAIVGEAFEWETPEYVRDAADIGLNKALIVIGHQKSEEAGMKYLADEMKSMFPGLPVSYIPTSTSMRFV